MTFESITYKHNNLSETKLLTPLVEQKFESLKKFIPVQAVVLCEVEFEKKGTQQHGRVHHVEANLSINGIVHRAEATENSFEKAIDVVRGELERGLKTAKDKEGTLSRRAGRMLKNLLQRY